MSRTYTAFRYIAFLFIFSIAKRTTTFRYWLLPITVGGLPTGLPAFDCLLSGVKVGGLAFCSRQGQKARSDPRPAILESNAMTKKQVSDFTAMKGSRPITMLTAYTCPVARGLQQAGVPVLLVGDTVGMVEMGFDSTRDVTLEHMEYHLGAVRRGAPDTHIIGDLPYRSDRDPDTALASARRLLAAGADSVKLEGDKYAVIAHLVANGIDRGQGLP